MEFEFFIGIDVSKSELDIAVQQGKRLLFHKEICNDIHEINAFIRSLSGLPGFDLDKQCSVWNIPGSIIIIP